MKVIEDVEEDLDELEGEIDMENAVEAGAGWPVILAFTDAVVERLGGHWHER